MTSLRTTIVRGVAHSAVAVVIARMASLATQVVLGIVLSDADWGTYAAALAIATVFVGFRDAGVSDLIAERGDRFFRGERRRVTAVAAGTNLALATALCALSVPARNYFDAAAVAQVLWLTAAGLIIGTPAAIAKGVLRARLEFSLLAQMNSAVAVMRAFAAIAAAVAGFGAVSFAIGLPAIALVESVVLWRRTRPTRPPIGSDVDNSTSETGGRNAITRDTVWLLVAAAGTGLLVNGDYLVLSTATTAASVGQYYFAYRLVSQATTLVTASLTPVLIPSLVSLRADPAGLKRRLDEVFLVLGTGLAPMSLLLAVNFEALDELLWGAAWQEAQVAVWCLSIVFPVRATFVVARSLLIAHRKYRAVAIVTVSLAVGLLTVTALTTWQTTNISWVAAAVSIYLSIAVGLSHRFAFSHSGIAASAPLRSLTPPLVVGVAAAGVVALLDHLVWSNDGHSLLRIAANTITFGGLYLVGLVKAAPEVRSAILPLVRQLRDH